MGEYFCGWYFRCQSDRQTLAVIPSVHKTNGSKFCAIQLITDSQPFHVRFPYSAFQKKGDLICIGNNRFGRSGLSLELRAPGLRVSGAVRFGAFTPIRYDIMGPFRFVPFMQCRHRVYSMAHRVSGVLTVNGEAYEFRNAVGYAEGDRGRSFPREYAWTQCCFPGGSIMLSVADIPLGRTRFTGVIGIVLLNGKEYRLATYLGGKAVRIKGGEITVRQGRLLLTVKQRDLPGYPLLAPTDGDMTRTIREHPSCRVYYLFKDGDVTLLEYEASNAAFEYEYA